MKNEHPTSEDDAVIVELLKMIQRVREIRTQRCDSTKGGGYRADSYHHMSLAMSALDKAIGIFRDEMAEQAGSK